jgi:uncharacterized protein
MSGSRVSLPPAVLAAAAEHAQAIVSEVAGVSAVVIATIDGFDVASALRSNIDAPRIAALASSIAAIGEVVSSEAGLGNVRCVTVETDAGFAVAHRVARADVPMVVKVLGRADAVLAQVKYRAAASALALERA